MWRSIKGKGKVETGSPLGKCSSMINLKRTDSDRTVRKMSFTRLQSIDETSIEKTVVLRKKTSNASNASKKWFHRRNCVSEYIERDFDLNFASENGLDAEECPEVKHFDSPSVNYSSHNYKERIEAWYSSFDDAENVSLNLQSFKVPDFTQQEFETYIEDINKMTEVLDPDKDLTISDLAITDFPNGSQQDSVATKTKLKSSSSFNSKSDLTTIKEDSICNPITNWDLIEGHATQKTKCSDIFFHKWPVDTA